jgi:response regulator RpfG family c-di-GMP phosphodiesterase
MLVMVEANRVSGPPADEPVRRTPPMHRQPPAPTGESLTDGRLPAAARGFLDEVRAVGLADAAALAAFLDAHADRLPDYTAGERLGRALVQAGLLTPYQLDRLLSGTTYGLVLGGYRVLEELGSGGMGKVFLAEHGLLRRRVAVKVLPVDEDCPAALRQRFYAEMRVLADLHHPNVVLAYDAGEVPPPAPNMPGLSYLVMELVAGGDLDRYVSRRGPCPVAEACDYARQAACGLQAAHDRHLIHRDVKPSNLLRAGDGRIKLVDFGLARRFSSRLTDHRVLLGSLDFMAPEQSHDPSAVGPEADVYGLGATLFWLLTGRTPYPAAPNVGASLRQLRQDEPRPLRSLLPDAPAELEELLVRLLERDPARRPPTALAVQEALRPFAGRAGGVYRVAAARGRPGRPPRALVVDDDESMRRLNRAVLEGLGCDCAEAADGAAALEAAGLRPFDLVLLDLNLPGPNGLEVCARLRRRPTEPNLKIIVVSAQPAEELAAALPHGADDYVAKPFGARELAARVEHALKLKEAQDQATRLAEEMARGNEQLRLSLDAREGDVQRAHDALLFAMAKMAESRDGETPGHMRRLQGYTAALARRAALRPPWLGLVDERFLRGLERCVPLHDIGKIGLPDEVLLKPGPLTTAERRLVETHPLTGDRILESLGREHGASLDFLGMARGIVRSHHERWDGKGYPDGLAGDAIPAAARLTAVADVYDALRRERLHKPALSHADSLHLMLKRSHGQFDPSLTRALCECHADFERIYEEMRE